MITERDLREAIAECQGVRNPGASTCIKLAAYLTILDHLQTEAGEIPQEPQTYSYAANTGIELDSGTSFAEAVNGLDPSEILPVVDELMTTLQAVNPRLYAGVMRRIKGSG